MNMPDLTAITFFLLGVTLQVGAQTINIEVEKCAGITPPARVVSVSGASGGQAIEMSAPDAPEVIEDSRQRPLDVSLGEVVADFDVPKAARYYLWVRVQWHCVCSRAVSFSTTASTFELSPELKNANDLVVRSYQNARLWHWLRIGEAEFGEGPQSITFTQRGHLTLVDCMAISSDPAYLPPGYTRVSRCVNVAEASPEWVADNRGRSIQHIDSDEWHDFQFTVSMKLPVSATGSGTQRAGVGFCSQPDGSGYELLVERTSEATVLIRLCSVTAGTETEVFAAAATDSPELWHSIEVVKIGDEVATFFDGCVVRKIRDGTYAGGTIRMIAEGTPAVVYEDAEIKEVAAYREIFNDGLGGWKMLGGAWNNTAMDSGTDAGGSLLGEASAGGVALPPWALGGCFTAGVKVRVMSGFAGIAFDLDNDSNFTALVVKNDVAPGSEKFIKLLKRENGAEREICSYAAGSSDDQWNSFMVQKQEDSVCLFLDGEQYWRIEESGPGGKIGLFANGTASFCSFDAMEYADRGSQRFLFEEAADSRSLSYWRQKAGSFSFQHHPDLLIARPCPENGAIELEFRQSITNDFQVIATFSRQAFGEFRRQSNSAGDFPDIPMPVLPDDPRIGIRISSGELPETYEASIDYGTCGHFVLTHNGEAILNKYNKAAAAHPEVKFGMRVCDGTLEAGIMVDGRFIDSGAETLGGPKSFTIVLFASNMKGDRHLAISEIAIEKLCQDFDRR